jgi:flagellar biosynthesis/type III secretory pathway protein FliH
MEELRAEIIDLLAQNPGESVVDALRTFIEEKMSEEYQRGWIDGRLEGDHEGYGRGYDDGYDVGLEQGRSGG